MSLLIGVCGHPSSGKTYSLRNLPPEQTFIITPFKMDLPFAGANVNYKPFDQASNTGNVIKLVDMNSFKPWLEWVNGNTAIKYLVIDDLTHAFTAKQMGAKFRNDGLDAKKTWTRWEALAAEVYQALFGSAATMRDDLTIINIYHAEEYLDKQHNEKLRILVPGQMLNKKVKIQSYYTYLMFSTVVPFDKDEPQPASERYQFCLNDDGFHSAKMPPPVFGDDVMYIENDMMLVIDHIHASLNGNPLRLKPKMPKMETAK